MIAVIKTGGKQYVVKAGQILKVEKLEGKKGESISLQNVLAVSDTSNHKIGIPIIKEASVEAKILEHVRDKKIIVFKKRKRKNYRLTQGHRQYLTVLKIESITHENKKYSAPIKKLSNKEKIIKKEETKKVKNTIVKKTTAAKKTATKNVKKKAATKKTKTKI